MIPKEQLPAKRQLLELSLLLAITIAAYSPVLFNFFLGDDFVHLSWLSKCIHDPSLLLRNFNHSWLDVITTKFYRPLISVFMYTDYIIWRTNGFGFHLTNVLFHLANCTLVFAITSVLARSVAKHSPANAQSPSISSARQISWPFTAALLFGLYPLHPEAVSWITGRVDTIVTTFYLASVWLYMEWIENKQLPNLVLALISMALALMSKEMAITIPGILFCWGLFRLQVTSAAPANGTADPSADPSAANSSVNSKGIFATNFLKAIKATLINTSGFWILLAVYAIVRRLALGTFVGGYDNSLFFIPNLHTFISGWLHSIKMTLLPINREIMSEHNVIAIAWCIGMAASGVGVIRALLSPKWRGVTLLLMAFITISIIPVYKLFSIADDLESSRLVYLTSSFLCILLGLGLNQVFLPPHLTRPLASTIPGSATSNSKSATILPKLNIAVHALFLICAFTILWRNNLVWREAGLECTAIRAGLEQVCATLPDSAHLLLVGLPDQLHGAYMCRNATPGAIEPPQFSKTLKDCIFLNSYDPVFPFGFLRRSLQENAAAVNIFTGAKTRKSSRR